VAPTHFPYIPPMISAFSPSFATLFCGCLEIVFPSSGFMGYAFRPPAVDFPIFGINPGFNGKKGGEGGGGKGQDSII